jgi:hypothetical protein
LAPIPPTRAAAAITTSGRVSSKNADVTRVSRRSSSVEVRPMRFRNPWAVKWRQSAEPTRPLCPATKIRVSGDKGRVAGCISGNCLISAATRGPHRLHCKRGPRPRAVTLPIGAPLPRWQRSRRRVVPNATRSTTPSAYSPTTDAVHVINAGRQRFGRQDQ